MFEFVRARGYGIGVAFVTALGVAGFAGAADAIKPEVAITVQADGTHCAVANITLPCSGVVAHLRDVLKLPAGYTVRLRAGRATSHHAVRKVMDMLDRSGYPLPVARAPDSISPAR